MPDFDSLKDNQNAVKRKNKGASNIMQERHWTTKSVYNKIGSIRLGPTKNVPTDLELHCPHMYEDTFHVLRIIYS